MNSPDYLYYHEVQEFLDAFKISISDIYHIWDKSGKFLPPEELLSEIVTLLGASDKAKSVFDKISSFSIQKLSNSNAYPRMDFMTGLADLYRLYKEEKVSIIEIDIGNSNGMAKYLGETDTLRVFRDIHETFLKTLHQSGASFCFTFDNARNDDFRIIVGGISVNPLRDALRNAQKKIDEKYVFAESVPHSKYKGTPGVGVGYVSFSLGGKQSFSDFLINAEKEIDKSKKVSTHNRRSLTDQFPMRKRIPLRAFAPMAASFLKGNNHRDSKAEYSLVTYKADEAERARIVSQLVEQNRLSDMDKSILEKLVHFCIRKDEMTGAIPDRFLISNIKETATRINGDVTVLNFKLENCAGVNKFFSRQHSIAMTRHYVSLVGNYIQSLFPLNNCSGVYYTGRNYFTAIIPQKISALDEVGIRNGIATVVDKNINDKTVIDYFRERQVPMPEFFNNSKIKMSDIPNMRGNEKGISTIRFFFANFTKDMSENDFYLFQRKARGDIASIKNEYNRAVLEGLSPEIFDNNQIPSVTKLYQAAKSKKTYRRS